MSEVDQTRRDIVLYLKHVARVEVGTLLNEHGREFIELVAHWIENELDQKWKAQRAEQERKEQ